MGGSLYSLREIIKLPFCAFCICATRIQQPKNLDAHATKSWRALWGSPIFVHFLLHFVFVLHPNQRFRAFAEEVHEEWKYPSSEALSNELLEDAEQAAEQDKQDRIARGNFGALMCDIWTSPQRTSLINFIFSSNPPVYCGTDNISSEMHIWNEMVMTDLAKSIRYT